MYLGLSHILSAMLTCSQPQRYNSVIAKKTHQHKGETCWKSGDKRGQDTKCWISDTLGDSERSCVWLRSCTCTHVVSMRACLCVCVQVFLPRLNWSIQRNKSSPVQGPSVHLRTSWTKEQRTHTQERKRGRERSGWPQSSAAL